MSAFFVSKKTIDDCIALKHPSQMSGDEIGTREGKLLIAMNICALVQRYPQIRDTPEHEMYLTDLNEYVFEEHKDTSEAQQLKSLNCLLYQCAEGNVPESHLYKRLDKLGDDITEALSKGRQVIKYGEYVPHVPGYDEAEWDRS